MWGKGRRLGVVNAAVEDATFAAFGQIWDVSFRSVALGTWDFISRRCGGRGRGRLGIVSAAIEDATFASFGLT